MGSPRSALHEIIVNYVRLHVVKYSSNFSFKNVLIICQLFSFPPFAHGAPSNNITT
jgi:hypothetical protein